MKRKIAMIGANEQQNPLILKARAMGFETHVFAWQTGDEIGEQTADHFYPISAGNKEEILEVCRQLQVSAVVSIGSDISAQSASYVCQQMGLYSNTYAATVCASNKLLSRMLFQKCGIPQPDFVEIGDKLPLDAINALGYPLVIKPSDRSGGRGLTVVKDRYQLPGAINRARELSFERKAIAERYVSGQLYSCECISFEGAHTILGITRRNVLELQGSVKEHIHEIPAYLSQTVVSRLESLIPQILDTLGLRSGASSVEFIVDAQKHIFVVEVTPSMYGDFIGTHLIPASTGHDYLQMVIDLACGKAPELKAKPAGKRAQVRFVYSKEDLLAYETLDGEVLASGFPAAAFMVPEKADGSRYGYYVWEKQPKPFGGCAPMDCGSGKEWFSGKHILCVNSEYTAFWYALRQMQASKVWIPHYCAPHWERVARAIGAEVAFYHIDETFTPKDLGAQPSDAVLLVDYFGQCTQWIRSFARKHKNVVVDHSMAFFAIGEAADRKEEGYHIFSARKFFAVADGAFLVCKDLQGRAQFDLEKDVSYRRMTAHLKALELGEEAAYKEQQANEQALLESRKAMSNLTKKLLAAVDMDAHKRRRAENFAVLHKMLEPFQQLSLSTGSEAVPQFYPLLVDRDIRSILVSNKIFVPLMWRKHLEPEFADTFEQKLAKGLLCLPIDPRYSTEDMEYLAQIIIPLLD